MELLRSTSHRGFSLRGILTFVTAVVITALLWATLGSHTPTHAVDVPAATWKGDSILYDGHRYFPINDKVGQKSLGLPDGTTAFTYIPDVPPNTKSEKALVLYFSPGVDPPAATTVSFASYTYTFATKEYSNPTNKMSVDITVKGDEDSYSSCNVNGIGWFICPVAVFLSEGMDKVFEFVAGFMAVQPSNVADTNNTLFIAWNIMRSIANVAFIIVFLIIIYSQLTNAGVSNYGLKKLLPRLVVAAVLVNLSYIITAIAVDLSNILGYSLQEIFVNIRQETFNITDDTWSESTTNWTTLTAAVLSGGAIGVAGITLAGDLSGVVYVVLPLLVGLILTVLFVLLILAARQAIIVLLIIISPLAFVAYLLPNTEDWFKKWRGLFMTMLIFFPAFSLVFGGSQLAGGLIIQSATSVFMIVFGLAVQVAPLVITPLILRFSGGVLGKIGGLINDPRKGLLDRTKNWSKERQDMLRLRSMAKPTNGNPFRAAAKSLDNRSRRVKERTALYTAMGDNRYNSTDWHQELHGQEHNVHLDKERIENNLKTHTLHQANRRGTETNLRTIELESSKTFLESATESNSAMLAEYRSGTYNTGNNQRLSRLQSAMAAQTIQTAAEKQRQLSAQYVQQKNISTEMSNDASRYLDIAQGVGGSAARIRARSTALAALNKLEAEALENNVKLMSEVALTQGKTTKQYSNDLVNRAINGDTSISESDLAAALQAQAGEKNISLFERARGSRSINQELLNKIIINNAGTFKEAGGYHLQDDLSLNVNVLGAAYEQTLAAKRVETIGNASATGFDKLKFGWVADFADHIAENIAAARALGNTDDLKKAYNNARNALTNEDILATLGDREDQVRAIEAALAAEFGQAPTPDDRPF